MASPSTAHVELVHANSPVGPTIGSRLASTSSWDSFDLRAYIGRFVRVRMESQSAYLCMCASTSATPETSTTAADTADTDNVAELFFEGEVDQWVVTADKPYLLFLRGASTNGTVFVRPA